MSDVVYGAIVGKAVEYLVDKVKDKVSSLFSQPRTPAEIDPIPTTSETGIKSRDSVEDEIMNALKDEKVYLIGLCGMGGVGKTTMAKKIEERVRNQKSMFELVLFATVSQKPDSKLIQQQIADGLGLKLSESVQYRARELRDRLKAEKSVLIILDDVWKSLELDEIGSPTPDRCKLLLTSRNEDAFILPGNSVSKTFQLKVLDDEESLLLFRGNIGSAADSPDLKEIAEAVAKECKGLPIALKTVGRALRNRGKSSWENALIELRKSLPINVAGVVTDVYGPLMYSFEHLESEEAKNLFLLCCLFQEDYTISLEQLVGLGLGLRIFESLGNLTDSRNRVESILEILISRSLLIGSRDRCGVLCVKMHDVLRDVGIWIASKERHVFMVSHGIEVWPMTEEESYGNYTCISLLFSRKDVDIPELMDCPRLVFLSMGLINSWRNYFDKRENFFSRMPSLRVLVASNFGSLPPSVGRLNNLRTLHLSNCQMCETTSVIGMLANLEILRLKDCEVDVLPIEIGGLKKLKQLYIFKCFGLRVELDVISGLLRLEELVILGSFDNWEAETNGTSNARLSELDCLNHLTTLRIEISNPSVIPTQMPDWVQRVKNYGIAVSGFINSDSIARFLYLDTRRFNKAITLTDSTGTPLGDWLYDMASDAECLSVDCSSCAIVVKRLARYSRSLIDLRLSGFTNVQYLVWGQQNGAIFPKLRSLHIADSASLQEISNVPPPAGSFEALEKIELQILSGLTCLWKFSAENLYLSNLKSVKLDGCGKLSYLFSLSIAQSLSRLEVLRVSRCQSMEDIFKKEDGETEIKKLEFPKLVTLHLISLQSLRRLCNGVDAIEVPALRSLKFVNLPSIIAVGDPHIHQRSLFQQRFAGRVQILILQKINNIKSLFSPSILGGFSNLQKLEVGDCSELEEIIDENVGEAIVFPKLTDLELFDLPKIICFCYTGVEFPLLKKLHIRSCPLMERFSQRLCDTSNSSVALPFFHKEFAGNFSGLQILILQKINNFKCLFSPSILRGFSNLQKLEVRDCSELEEIIEKDENVGETIVFPKLSNLELFHLPKILCFCYTGVEFPLLEELNIEFCFLMERFCQRLCDTSNSSVSLPFFHKEFAGNFSGLQILILQKINNFKCLFSPSILRGFSNLQKLEVRDCSELEEIIENDENAREAIVFPKLTNLELFDLPKILCFCYTRVEFPLLKKLHISCPLMERFCQRLCDTSNSSVILPFFHKEFAGNLSGLQILILQKINNFKCLFSPSILGGFSNLQKLEVRDCSELEEIIGKDENVGETIVFPKLSNLELLHLPKILCFCYTGVEFPLLEELNIEFCFLMERFCQRLCDTSKSSVSLPFFHKEDHCPKLKSLRLLFLPNIARIFDLPTFRALTNLEKLVLEYCGELQEMIANEEVEGQTNIEEILSPQLNELNLHGLPKIRRFCPMKHCLKFPSLERASFTDCPMLERFSLGPLHLPNIKRIDGLPNAEFAVKFFFNKEISSRPIHPENNCFTISATEIFISFASTYPSRSFTSTYPSRSFISTYLRRSFASTYLRRSFASTYLDRSFASTYLDRSLKWFLTPDSSESFVDTVKLPWCESAEVVGNFETAKLATEVVYETTIVIMLDTYAKGWKEPVELQLTIPGGITQKCTKILDELPREEWIEVSLGKFTRESHQSGQLEFVLRIHEERNQWWFRSTRTGLSVKGFRIMKFRNSGIKRKRI